MEIVLLSSEPNPYKLAFIYEMLIFYNFMTANCKITQVLIEFKLYLVDFILVNNKVISLLLLLLLLLFFFFFFFIIILFFIFLFYFCQFK